MAGFTYERLYRFPHRAPAPNLKLETRNLLLRQLLDRRFQIRGMEPKRPRLALIRDLTLSIDQVQPIRPARVGHLGRVLESVNYRRKLNSQLAHTCSCKERTFFFILGTGKNDLVLDIALHLPHVAGPSCWIGSTPRFAILRCLWPW